MSAPCRLILITGFLGAGKTTLLRALLKNCAGKSVRLIVNEFGRIGVDGALLQGLGAGVEEIVDGSIFCACRIDRFEAALDEAQRLAPELVLVEASGLSDPTAMRALLEQSGRYPGIRYGGCIAVADATNLHRVIDTARVCRKQLSVADLIALSKTDIASGEQTEAVIGRLQRDYPGVRIVRGPWEQQSPDILDTLTARKPARLADRTRDLTLQKRCVAVSPDLHAEELRAFLRLLSEVTCRIKGFVRLREGPFLVDCVGAYCSVTPTDRTCEDNRLAVLAGEGMPLGKALREALSWYEGMIWEVP